MVKRLCEIGVQDQGTRLGQQIEGMGGGTKTPEMLLKPFGRFWGAIWGAVSDTSKSLIVDFDLDPAVFCTSIDCLIWLDRT